MLTRPVGFMSPASASWDPSKLPGLDAWLRADLGITKDGGNLVSAWLDQGSHGVNASAAGAARPLWVDSAVNGHPIIRFTAATSVMALAAAMPQRATSTIFAVMKFANNVAYNALLNPASGGITTFCGIPGVAYDQPIIYQGGDLLDYTAVDGGAGTHYSALWRIEWDGTKIYITRDGEAGVSATVAVATGYAYASLGAAGYCLDGDLAELVIVNHKATSPEVALMLAYSRTRYGTA